jgi:GNAT superfamily N-acetyltransferase
MALDELESFYTHIIADFIPGEYPPYDILAHQLEHGIQEGLVFCRGAADLAYAITAVGENEYVLISLCAVLPEYRSQGIGSLFIAEMAKRYSGKKALIVEVEKPETAKDAAGQDVCCRRIMFYERLGFSLVPHIDFTIWDIPLHVMVHPLSEDPGLINGEIGNIMRTIYLSLMGKDLIHRMTFRRTD